MGAVNILVHCVGLTALYVIACSSKRSMRLCTRLRLSRFKRAPVVYESFASPFSCLAAIPRMIYSKSIALVFLALLLISTVPAELVLDSGVDLSEKCNPIRKPTRGLCANPSRPNTNLGTAAAILFHTSEWDDNHISEYPIYQGLHHSITGREFFGPDPIRNTSLPVVVAGCKVGKTFLLPPETTFASLFLGGPYIDSGFALVLAVQNGKIQIRTSGLMSLSFEAPFFIAHSDIESIGNTGFSTQVFEYFNFKHLLEEKKRLNASMRLRNFRLSTPLITYNVSCNSTGLTRDHIAESVLLGRIGDLEHTQTPIIVSDGKMSAQGLQKPTAAKIVRSILGAKFSYKEKCIGETFEWTTCGVYRFKYSFPLLVILCTVLLAQTFLEIRIYFAGDIMDIPMSAKEWYTFYEKVKFKKELKIQKQPTYNSLSSRLSSRSTHKSVPRANYQIQSSGDSDNKALAILPQD